MPQFSAYDWESWQPRITQLIQTIIADVAKSQQGQGAALSPVSIATQAQQWLQRDTQASPETDWPALYAPAVHLHHPGYIAHQVVAPTIPSVIAGFIASALNQGMAVSDMGQSATAIERAVVLKMLAYFGWKEGEGILTSGGSLGNLTALLAARQRHSNAWEEGVPNNTLVLVSADAHYCVDRAVKIMGMGNQGVVKMQPNAQHKITGEILEKHISAQKAAGKEIMAVVGSACSTGPGVFDDLDEMASVCQQHNIWFHVDAAHGGMLQLSEKHKNLLQGIDQADSLIIDFHKMGFTPALTTAVLYKKGKDSFLPFKQDASYLWSDADFEPWTQSGLRTVECTKLMMGLKAYANLFWLPKAELVGMMDHIIAQAQQFAEGLAKRAGWELFQTPEANIVCFRNIHWDTAQHKEKLQKLIAGGSHYIVSTVIDNTFYYRCTFMNVHTETRHTEDLLNKLENL